MSSIGPLTSAPPRREDPHSIQSLQDRYDALRPALPADREEECMDEQEASLPAHEDAGPQESSAGALAVAVTPLLTPFTGLHAAARWSLMGSPVPALPDGTAMPQVRRETATPARGHATTRHADGPAESGRDVLQAGGSKAVLRTVPGLAAGYAIARAQPANVDANAQLSAGMPSVVGAGEGAPSGEAPPADAIGMHRVITGSAGPQPTNAAARMEASVEARAADADPARVAALMQGAPSGSTSTPTGVAAPTAQPSKASPSRNGSPDVSLAAKVAAGAEAHRGAVTTLTVPLAGLGDGHSIMASWPHGMQGPYLQLRASSGLGNRLLSEALPDGGEIILGGWRVEASTNADDHQPRRHAQHEPVWEDD